MYYATLVSVSSAIIKNNQHVTDIISELRDEYETLLQSEESTKKDLYIFGLDSVFFQHALFLDELTGLKRLYKTILNKIYCENFKLLSLTHSFLINNKKKNDDTSEIDISIFSPYQYLNDNIEYCIHDACQMYRVSERIINTLIQIQDNKQQVLTKYNDIQSNRGLQIQNFVASYDYEIQLFDRQIALFKTYMAGLNTSHTSLMMDISERFLQFKNRVCKSLNKDDNDIAVNNKISETNDNDKYIFDNVYEMTEQMIDTIVNSNDSDDNINNNDDIDDIVVDSNNNDNNNNNDNDNDNETDDNLFTIVEKKKRKPKKKKR
tara:strand:- start:55 stop:1014 length:960 start_codon:yes stop_codon:yes gene_type:complete